MVTPLSDEALSGDDGQRHEPQGFAAMAET